LLLLFPCAILSQKGEGVFVVELRQIYYFIEVVEQGSFTQAAEVCFISQSAISQQIKVLEEELGLPLLLRQGRGFTLTPAGDYFYRKSKAWLGGLDEIVKDTKRRAGWGERVLRIGFPGNYDSSELFEVVSNFAKQVPETVVQIMTGTHEELYDLLRFEGADLVVNDQRRAFSDAYVNCHLAYRPMMAEVCAWGSLAQQETITLEEARTVPCILVSSPGQEQHEQDYYHTTLGFGSRFLTAPTLEAARLLVSSNRGILPLEGNFTSSSEKCIKRLTVLQKGEPLMRRYCAFWRKEQTHPDLPLFASLLKTAFQDQ
jgi:DNA-binding transcriptional LysR family regulator